MEAASTQAQTKMSSASKGKAKAAPSLVKQRQARIRNQKLLRIVIQAVFLVLAPGLFSAAFNGVKYLFTQIGMLQGFEATSFVIVLVALLAYTVLFGRFFCGYACAFGTIGDWVYGITSAIWKKTPFKRLEIPERAMKALSLVKYIVLGAICVACFLGVWTSVSGYSPWVAFAGFTSASLEGIEMIAFALFAICVLGMMFSERFFCRVFCPMGAVFALLPVLGFSTFTRTREHCAGKCGKCQEACPVDMWPDADRLSHGECISCGRCAEACPMCNVNFVAVPHDGNAAIEAKPQKKTYEKWKLVKGSESYIVIGKALILILVCWALGMTRYLPSFSETLGSVQWPF